MTTYIALLRGINVGGHRKIKMEDLKEMFRSMDFKNVATYIQSGNVVFDGPGGDVVSLSNSIMVEVDKTFGHDVPVIIRTPGELRQALAEFPFEESDGWKGYISFLSEKPDPEDTQKLEAYSSGIETFSIIGCELHSLVDKQTEKKPLFSNSFIEKKLGVKATTRNLRTVNKILEMTQP